jgi:sirohydrochlorin ferrochelatase
MTAPSLVLLGYGSNDPRVAQISHEIRAGLLDIRPELDVHVAFLDYAAPTGLQVANTLVRHGVTEVVFVPLLLSDAFHTQVEVPTVIAQVKAAHPGLQAVASRPIGPEIQLLTVIDRRLRDVLRSKRVSELDGLVFSAAGSTDVRSNAIVARRARQWSSHHRLPCVTAFATPAGPSTGQAVRTLRGQGRRHIAVGSWFLAPGVKYAKQAELALQAGAVAVSEPLGAQPEIAEAALTRYVVAAMELVDLGVELPPEETEPVRHLSVVGA